MKRKEGLIPGVSGFVVGDVTRNQSNSLLYVLGKGGIIGIELYPSQELMKQTSIFTLHIEQPLEPTDPYIINQQHQYASLNVFFKKNTILNVGQGFVLTCHLQIDYAMGLNHKAKYREFINGFKQTETDQLSVLLGTPIDGIWYIEKQNIIRICFESTADKPAWYLCFEGKWDSLKEQMELIWSYESGLPKDFPTKRRSSRS